jgi:hypothetical protein
MMRNKFLIRQMKASFWSVTRQIPAHVFLKTQSNSKVFYPLSWTANFGFSVLYPLFVLIIADSYRSHQLLIVWASISKFSLYLIITWIVSLGLNLSSIWGYDINYSVNHALVFYFNSMLLKRWNKSFFSLFVG